MFYEIAVLKTFAKLTRKICDGAALLVKLLVVCRLTQKSCRRMRFPMNFENFFRATFLQNISVQGLLNSWPTVFSRPCSVRLLLFLKVFVNVLFCHSFFHFYILSLTSFILSFLLCFNVNLYFPVKPWEL